MSEWLWIPALILFSEIASRLIMDRDLFRIDIIFKEDLQKGNLSEYLRDMFRDKNYSLSDKAKLQSISEKEWKIIDGDRRPYIIKSNNKQLNIYSAADIEIEDMGLFGLLISPFIIFIVPCYMILREIFIHILSFLVKPLVGPIILAPREKKRLERNRIAELKREIITMIDLEEVKTKEYMKC